MPTDFDFHGYYFSLEAEEREAFAKAASTTMNYIQVHLVHGQRIPRPDMMANLVRASAVIRKPFTLENLVLWFQKNYGRPRATERVAI